MIAVLQVPETSPKQLDTVRKNGSARPQIIDVPTGAEWRSGHVAGAIRVPITELGSCIGGLHVDESRPIVAICRAAHRMKKNPIRRAQRRVALT